MVAWDIVHFTNLAQCITSSHANGGQTILSRVLFAESYFASSRSTFDQRAILISSSSEDPNDYSSDRLFGASEKRKKRKRDKKTKRERERVVGEEING